MEWGYTTLTKYSGTFSYSIYVFPIEQATGINVWKITIINFEFKLNFYAHFVLLQLANEGINIINTRPRKFYRSRKQRAEHKL